MDGSGSRDSEGDDSEGSDDPLARRMEHGHDLEAASPQWDGSEGGYGEGEDAGGGEDDGDDECMVCGEGGRLIMCDGCSNAAHTGCVSLAAVPAGDWFCRMCERWG